MATQTMKSVQHGKGRDASDAGHGHYWRLLLMILLSYVAMYVLMYAMVDRFDNVYLNLNNAYMAGLMAAPMLVIELALMGAMYGDRRLNLILMVAGVLLLALFWFGMRWQSAIGDRQFLRSMIPHHAGAILMCREAPVRDPEITRLCGQIAESQQKEIEQMKAILARLDAH